MTRRHFRALAQALRNTRPGENWDANKRAQWNLDVKAVLDICASENSNFDRHRFIEACGGLFDV
jgi:hypothetical protein